MSEYDKYLECLDNEPDTVEEDLKQVNKFVNNNCTVEELWAHFARTTDELHADLVITSSLLYASVKWHYEIFQQRPLEPTEAKAELIKLLDQLHIDKPHIFKDSFISQRYFCELAHYLKLMYAGNLSSEDDEKSAFEIEEDIPVLAFDRADEFSNQKLPSLPFPCLIVDSSSAKAWTSALKKLNHAAINDLRGEIGNAIDWNKLNDTFLVDFKGSMFWLPRNSIQPAEEHTGSGTGSRSEAETAPSITVEGHRSEGRTTEPDEDNSIISPFLNRLQNKFQKTGVFTQRLYAVIKGSPVTADNDENVEHPDYAPSNGLDEERHNRSYSHQPRNRENSAPRLSARLSFSHQKQLRNQTIYVYVTEDLGQLTAFFSNYDVSAKEIMRICGRKIEASQWNSTRQQAQIVLNDQTIWLPKSLAHRVFEAEEPEPPLSSRSSSQNWSRREEKQNVVGIRQLRDRFHEKKMGHQMDKARSLSAISDQKSVSGFRSDDGNISVVSSHVSPPSHSSLLSAATQMSPSPPSILVNEKRARSKSKSPKKKASFSMKNEIIPSPGFYYVQRNRNLLFKKCTVQRLDSRRLFSFMGRRVEVTHIDRNGCGVFTQQDRTFLIPMSCLSTERPSAVTSPA